MNIKEVLREEKLKVKPTEETIKELKNKVNELILCLEKELKKQKVPADVFIGGSFAKGTLLKRKDYDIDVLIRFDWRLEKISDILERIVNNTSKLLNKKTEKLHGSRDYFRIYDGEAIFEIIPVYKIKKPREARNITDLSYFHVNYVKKKLKGKKIAEEILLSKSFCKAQGVYGAESYINGFSGYGLECLLINYGSFLKMLKELVKVKIGERIILDPGKHYKKKNDVLFSLNEARLQSPIILVDPTWKERNVLAALSRECFEKFSARAKDFLKNPSKKFFETSQKDAEKIKEIAKKKKGEFLQVDIETNKQEGDIAGTKMKKFSRFIESELRRYFDVIEREFIYSEGQKAEFYLAVKPKKKIVIYGPPIEMKSHAISFKKKHKNSYIKKGKLYSEIKANFSARDFLQKWAEKNKGKMNEMGIVGMRVD
ncbi:MAG: nucleotidyltransferase domain-containing protein [Nanoarchaeota archaeon]|nr:nucleotidyltransferase domain-containing protein [Nanoarchaeota archaeon]